jgi:membrane protein implicated in regulation of membrane protease activity
MRWEVVGWGALALLLFAAEALAPGAFMLWIGIGAAAVFVLVAVFSGIPLLWQVVAFVVLSVVSIQCYRRWGRQGRDPAMHRCSTAAPSSWSDGWCRCSRASSAGRAGSASMMRTGR